VFVALVLTPALCATMLKPSSEHGERKGFFGWFNRTFDRGADRYQRGVHGIIRRPLRFFVIYLLMCAGAALLFSKLPSSFLPEEDQGVLMTTIQLPVGATSARTLEVVKQVEEHFLNQEKD